MRTIVALENGNCTWCHNAMVETLRASTGVQRVHADFSAGCLIVEHESAPEQVISVIRDVGRAVGVATNGEKVMIRLDAHEQAECHVRSAR